MPYAQKDYSSIIGIKGFSETLLKNHFTLYQGYVTNTNKSADALSLMLKDGKTGTVEYAELKRRFGWEFNGMRLHELYFENLGGDGAIDRQGQLGKQMDRDFGGIAEWEKDFRACGAMRGIGWVILYQDSTGDRLFNAWINEHDVGHLAGCSPVLVMDVFEHAYLTDYQLKRAEYIDAFFKSIDWKAAASRIK